MAPDDDAVMAAGGAINAHVAAGLMSNVRRALEEGGCDALASARVLNLLEQDAVSRDLENLRILIELARSEKMLVASQQALAAREAEVASLSMQTAELEQANSALVKRAHQIRKSGSSALHEQLQDALNQLQQLRADFEDKKEQCDGMMRVRNFLVDELSEANLQLQAVHLQLAQANVCIADLHAGIDLVLSGADPKAVFQHLRRQQSNGRM